MCTTKPHSNEKLLCTQKNIEIEAGVYISTLVKLILIGQRTGPTLCFNQQPIYGLLD
uniref:Uncharacterized protein n=1 Tax=Arion vulgaris TaxID=1028688 RepID=A0A0B7BTH6_9EUPU